MCFHDKPTRNDQNSYGIKGRAPALNENDTLIYDECGRCGPSPQTKGRDSIDYHSHHFRLVSQKFGPYVLIVRHGMGDERINLGHEHTKLPELLKPMSSDFRYLMLHVLYDTNKNAARKARGEEELRWRKAAAEKRIKTRKMPKQKLVKVWIEKEA